MATRHWTLQFDGEIHTVRLEHGFWLSSRQIWIDDKLVEKSRKMMDYGSRHVFKIVAAYLLMMLYLYRTKMRSVLHPTVEVVGDVNTLNDVAG